MTANTFKLPLLLILVTTLMNELVDNKIIPQVGFVCYFALVCAYFLVMAVILWKRARMVLTSLGIVCFVGSVLVLLSVSLRTGHHSSVPLWVIISAASLFLLGIALSCLSNMRYLEKLLVIKENVGQASMKDILLFKHIPRFEA